MSSGDNLQEVISPQDSYNELALYTLEHAKTDPSFIHQYVVDAFAAQNADKNTKPITIAFALIGLYLHLEKNYSGREVQLAHIALAKRRKDWPTFLFPENRGDMTVVDVLKFPPGRARDIAIKQWSESVWRAWHTSHAEVTKLVEKELGYVQIKVQK